MRVHQVRRQPDLQLMIPAARLLYSKRSSGSLTVRPVGYAVTERKVPSVVTAVLMFLRLCFVLALVLGLGFWANIGQQLIPLHIAVGALLVVAVWFLGLAQAMAPGGSAGLAILAVVVGAVLVAVGLGQNSLLPGAGHVVVRVVHPVVALLAVSAGEMSARRYHRLTRL